MILKLFFKHKWKYGHVLVDYQRYKIENHKPNERL
jgi:hypothetical protein